MSAPARGLPAILAYSLAIGLASLLVSWPLWYFATHRTGLYAVSSLGLLALVLLVLAGRRIARARSKGKRAGS